MIDKNMMKLAQIRNSYTMKRFGTVSTGEKALLDYESFCLELMKENTQLKEVIEEVWNFIKKYPGISQSGVMTIKQILDKVKEN